MSNLSVRDFGAAQTTKPYTSYRKTIPAQVAVTILSPETNQQEGLLLYGDPRSDERAVIHMWSEKEDMFFRRKNKTHLDRGTIIRIQYTEPVEDKTIEQYSDDELKGVLAQTKQFATFQKTLMETTSTAVIYRLLELAKEADKSDRIIKSIESRLSELQGLI